MTATETIPATMRVAVMYDIDDIRIEERPVPALEPGDALVRTGASGVCSGDLVPWYVRRKAPFVFGHEPAGTIVTTAGDTRFVPGTRVFAHHHAPCLHCDACRAGRYVHCATWRSTALELGGMAEYFRVPAANLVDTLALPEHVSFADGSLVEPLACVVKSLRRAFGAGDAADLAGRTLFVIGAGVMGLMHVALASARGATVYASDFEPARRAEAIRLGAEAAFEPSTAREGLLAATGGRLADAVICGPGSPAALAAAVDLTADDGTLLQFTPIAPGERFSFDQSRSYFRDLRLVASYSCGPNDTSAALGWIARGTVDARMLRAERFAFPEVAAAYAAMASGALVKAIVTFGAEQEQRLS